MSTMTAVQIQKLRTPMTVEQLPVPDIGEDEVLVRITASGICRTDWHVWNGDWTWAGLELPLPMVLGHEIAGVIDRVGSNVTSLKAGMRVCVPFNFADGTCPACRAGKQNLCKNASWPFLETGCGGYAQYAKVPNAELNCVPLPDNVSDRDGAGLGCRYMTAYRAVRTQSRLRAGETITVVGVGGVGRSAVQIAAASGAFVIAVDTKDSALRAAAKLGAVHSINADGMDAEAVGDAVKQLTGGTGADVAVDALGGSDSTLSALNSLAKGGRLTVAGLTTQQDEGQVAIPIDQLVFNEWSVTGSLGNPHSDYPELLQLVDSGVLSPGALISAEVSLGDVQDIFDRMPGFDTDGFIVITDFN